MEEFAVPHTTRCKLFDSAGDELSDEDIDFLDSFEPLFLSLGEEFCRYSVLALYEEVETLGQGGFGLVKLCQNRYSGENVAIKFISMN
jgi:serine/threonine protein kinase